jgi:hypothetical protein
MFAQMLQMMVVLIQSAAVRACAEAQRTNVTVHSAGQCSCSESRGDLFGPVAVHVDSDSVVAGGMSGSKFDMLMNSTPVQQARHAACKQEITNNRTTTIQSTIDV